MFGEKRFCCLLVLSLLTVLLVGKPAVAVMNVSLNHIMGRDCPAGDAVTEFAKLVEQRSKGEIKIKLFHKAELGDEVEMMNYMKLGSVEIGFCGSVLIGTVAPDYGALDVPYLFKDQAHLRRVIAGPIGKALTEKILERQGIRILGFMDRSPRHLTANKIIRNSGDLKGVKIRVRQIPVQIEAWRALGASPVPMAWSETYTALQTRVLDAQENPAELVYTLNVFEVQKYLILTAHVREVQWLFVSEKWFEKLNKEHQEILYGAAAEAMKLGDKLTLEKDTYYIQNCAKKGMGLIELTKGEQQAFMDSVKTVPDKFKDKWVPGLAEAMIKEGK